VYTCKGVYKLNDILSLRKPDQGARAISQEQEKNQTIGIKSTEGRSQTTGKQSTPERIQPTRKRSPQQRIQTTGTKSPQERFQTTAKELPPQRIQTTGKIPFPKRVQTTGKIPFQKRKNSKSILPHETTHSFLRTLVNLAKTNGGTVRFIPGDRSKNRPAVLDFGKKSSPFVAAQSFASVQKCLRMFGFQRTNLTSAVKFMNGDVFNIDEILTLEKKGLGYFWEDYQSCLRTFDNDFSNRRKITMNSILSILKKLYVNLFKDANSFNPVEKVITNAVTLENDHERPYDTLDSTRQYYEIQVRYFRNFCDQVRLKWIGILKKSMDRQKKVFAIYLGKLELLDKTLSGEVQAHLKCAEKYITNAETACKYKSDLITFEKRMESTRDSCLRKAFQHFLSERLLSLTVPIDKCRGLMGEIITEENEFQTRKIVILGNPAPVVRFFKERQLRLKDFINELISEWSKSEEICTPWAQMQSKEIKDWECFGVEEKVRLEIHLSQNDPNTAR